MFGRAWNPRRTWLVLDLNVPLSDRAPSIQACRSSFRRSVPVPHGRDCVFPLTIIDKACCILVYLAELETEAINRRGRSMHGVNLAQRVARVPALGSPPKPEPVLSTSNSRLTCQCWSSYASHHVETLRNAAENERDNRDPAVLSHGALPATASNHSSNNIST